MIDFLKWYLERFGSKDFIGLWLAWIGFVALCTIEVKRGLMEPSYEPSNVFVAVLGGVIGYVVRSQSERKKDE